MALSATDAAFSGFRVTLRSPLAVLGWSLAVFLMGLASSLLGVEVGGRELSALSTAQTPQALENIDWRALGLFYGLVLVLSLLAASVVYTAVYRSVLRPEQGRFAYLRLGGDEMRMFVVFLAVALVFIAGMFLISVPTWLTIFVGALAGGVWGGVVGVLAVLLTLPLVFAVPLWLWVRLSLAGPMTLDTGRIQLAAAWRLTRGHFWPMLGAYLLSAVFLLAIWAVTTPLSLAMAAWISGQGLMGIWTTSSTLGVTAADIFSPARLALLALTSLFSGLIYAVWLAPTADAYRQLRPSTDVSETFA